MKILTNIAHPGHQYELWKLPHDFTVVEDLGQFLHRPYFSRPLHLKIKSISKNDIDVRDYDLIICHIDEFYIDTPQIYPNWELRGEPLRYFMDLDLPKILLCHGAARFKDKDEYTVSCNISKYQNIIPEDYMKFEYDLDLINKFRETLKDIVVVCNSYQAQEEWGFHKSKVIWHGFDPEEFFMSETHDETILNFIAKLRNRVFCNGFYLHKEIQSHLNFKLQPTNMVHNITSRIPPDKLFFSYKKSEHEEQEYNAAASAQFCLYRTLLSKSMAYLNTTYKSPMPRNRGEAMMAGAIPVTTSMHDVDMFIKNGENGFYSNDPKELADVLHFLKLNSRAVSTLRKNARKTAIKYFHIDRYLSDWQNLLEEVV